MSMMLNIEKLLKLLLVNAVVLLLTSCAITTDADYTESLHADMTPSAEKGLLVASITREISALSKRGAIAFFFVRDKKTGVEFEMSSTSAMQDSVKPSAKTKAKNIAYKAIIDTASEDASFALTSEIESTQNQVGRVLAYELEPGMYEISKWKIVTAGGVDFANFDSEHQPPITFEVKSGEVSYLCNCHINIDIGEDIFGLAVEDDAEAEIYDKIQRDMQYVDEQYPNLGDLKVNNIAANLRNSDHPLAH
jgi:hypothetical protein